MKTVEVTTASPHVIVRRTDIAPFSQRRIVGRHTANETNETLSSVSNVAWRNNNYVSKSKGFITHLSFKVFLSSKGFSPSSFCFLFVMNFRFPIINECNHFFSFLSYLYVLDLFLFRHICVNEMSHRVISKF